MTNDLIADGQPFTADLLGLGAAELQALRRSGRVRPILRTVYVDAKARDDVRCRADAVSLVLPPGAVIGRRTAALLWGVDAFAREERHHGHVVECIVPSDGVGLSRPGVTCFEAQLGPADVTELRGLPITAPTRTATDLLRYLAPHLALGTADALTHLGLTSPQEIRAALAPLKGFRNIRQARRLAGSPSSSSRRPSRSARASSGYA